MVLFQLANSLGMHSFSLSSLPHLASTLSVLMPLWAWSALASFQRWGHPFLGLTFAFTCWPQAFDWLLGLHSLALCATLGLLVEFYLSLCWCSCHADHCAFCSRFSSLDSVWIHHTYLRWNAFDSPCNWRLTVSMVSHYFRRYYLHCLEKWTCHSRYHF